MGSVNFGDLKMKLIASVAAIATIALLRAFINTSEGHTLSGNALGWMIAMTLTFAPPACCWQLMDRLKNGGKGRS